jgi:prepilin peptidase CpaA
VTPEVALSLFVGLAATVEDLARRRISDWISILAAVGGIGLQIWSRGWSGALDSVLGLICGFVVFLIFGLLGGMGGGDIKLMAGFGAILGWKRVLVAALLTAGIGGLLAVIWLIGNAVANVVRQMRSGAAARKRIDHIPYAPAITLGAWLSLIPLS